jgi:hypothetical protein
MKTSSQTCAAIGCGASCQRGMLMCKACWYSVPTLQRRAVNKTWSAYKADPTIEGIKAYRVARDAAIAAAAEARP